MRNQAQLLLFFMGIMTNYLLILIKHPAEDLSHLYNAIILRHYHQESSGFLSTLPDIS
jgi:hypothetical protein